MTLTSGIHDRVPMDVYLADPAPAPSLSSHIADALLNLSPAHARHLHPRLNPALRRRTSDAFDLGNTVHALLLGGQDTVVIVDAPDWRKAEAKAQRDMARAAGKIALLKSQYLRAYDMADAARSQCDDFGERPTPLAYGVPERTLVWQEQGGVYCRARLDWAHADGRTIDDLKTVDGSANPERFSRQLFTLGYDVQAAMYLRGLRALTGVVAAFRFVVVEAWEPYALSVVSLAPAALALAERKVAHAIAMWRTCLESGRWPAYPARVAYVEAPGWAESQWMEREYASAPAESVDDGRSLAEQLMSQEDA